MMISCDTNILFPSMDEGSPHHEKARDFLSAHIDDEQFCICEQVLMELYCLLRNPAVCRHPLGAGEAAEVIQTYRSNPRWNIIDVTSTTPMMNDVWTWAAKPGTAYRRIFDLRLAATLKQHRVTEFATQNIKDFLRLGFERVWNPLK
jgi:toxin-antitoxin system PIN domain toxin